MPISCLLVSDVGRNLTRYQHNSLSPIVIYGSVNWLRIGNIPSCAKKKEAFFMADKAVKNRFYIIQLIAELKILYYVEIHKNIIFSGKGQNHRKK